jgi:hypothetical protein
MAPVCAGAAGGVQSRPASLPLSERAPRRLAIQSILTREPGTMPWSARTLHTHTEGKVFQSEGTPFTDGNIHASGNTVVPRPTLCHGICCPNVPLTPRGNFVICSRAPLCPTDRGRGGRRSKSPLSLHHGQLVSKLTAGPSPWQRCRRGATWGLCCYARAVQRVYLHRHQCRCADCTSPYRSGRPVPGQLKYDTMRAGWPYFDIQAESQPAYTRPRTLPGSDPLCEVRI